MTNIFYIESLGCISNKTDTARVANFFLANDWQVTDCCEKADLVILMTCGFTQVSEDLNLQRLNKLLELKKNGAGIIVGGCLPSISKSKLSNVFNGFVFSPRSLNALNTFISAKVSIETISPIGKEPDDPTMGTIKISSGCMGKCTYCAIPFANGRTKSRCIKDIIKDMKSCLDNNITKIKLVSEDLGAYGIDNGSTIVELLRSIILSGIECELYLDNMNPNWLKYYKSDLLELFHSPIIKKKFYIPVQSGSDRILSLMKRGYTVSDVRELLSDLYSNFEGIKISTDFIVGFPEETEADFEESRSLLGDYPFHHIEIFTYEPRTGTKAAKMGGQLSEESKELRRQTLFQDFLQDFLTINGISNNEELIKLLDEYKTLPVNFNFSFVKGECFDGGQINAYDQR